MAQTPSLASRILLSSELSLFLRWTEGFPAFLPSLQGSHWPLPWDEGAFGGPLSDFGITGSTFEAWESGQQKAPGKSRLPMVEASQ